MVKPKGIAANEAKKLPSTDDDRKHVSDTAKPTEKTKTSSTTKPSSTMTLARRGPGTKEEIPFQWKLVGESCGLALTLFKAVERQEVEAQLERVRREGYYGKLRILDIDEKVKQRASAKAPIDPRKGAKTRAQTKVAKAKRAGKKGAEAKAAKKARPAKKVSVGPPSKASVRKKVKAAKKGAKKKTATAKSTRKRAAKKK